MKTNYTPGQILYIKSSIGPWYYISVLHHTTSVGRMGREDELHTCCDLCVDTDGDCLTFARGNGTFLDLDTSFEVVREATDEERTQLFDALVKAFKEYDLSWANHFTDSTYDDIRDWLCWEFDVDLDNMDNNNPLGVTIYEITNYIWNTLCKETGNYQVCTDYVEPEMVNKQEFIEKACAWLKDTMYYLDCGDYERLTHYADTIEEMIDDFRKAMEE
jgi:hypothetical protein